MFLVVKKRSIVLAIAVIFAVAIAIPKKSNPTSNFVHQNSKVIVLDAGHGSPDGGAVGKSGTIESEINLKVTNNLKEELVNRGFTVIMTREDEYGISDKESIREKKKDDLKKRVDIINESNADIAVSIHMNNFMQSKYRGGEVIYSENFLQSVLLAELIQEEFRKIDEKNQTRSVKAPGRNIYLLKNSKIPTVIAECGFLSNPDEEALLNTDDYQKRVSASICDGIIKYYECVGGDKH